MDRSILRLPDPALPPPGGERRRTVRQKLQTPVYVSFQSLQSGMVLDLNELLDLHEYGFAVQTAVPSGPERNHRLEVNRSVPLRLDLTETKNYVDGTGQVMWVDNAGRAGIQFSSLPGHSRQILKDWLFANLLIASANHAARTEQLAQRLRERSSREPSADRTSEDNASADIGSTRASPNKDQLRASMPELVAMPTMVPASEPEPARSEPAAAVPDRSQLLSALDDVRREVRQLADHDLEGRDTGSNYEGVLRLITARATSLTGATGAALALLTDNRMTCRASTGDPAPPLSSEVDVRSGLSGECIRSGLVVTCEDTEADPRVDPEVCGALGIGSFMAAPIFVDFRVVGLLEIFSPYPHSFTTVHASVLQRLVELIPHIENKKTQPPAARLKTPESVPIEFAEPVPEEPDSANDSASPDSAAPGPAKSQTILAEENESPGFPSPERRVHFGHFALLVLVLGTIAMVMGYLLAPTIQRHWMTSAESSNASAQQERGSLKSLPSGSLQNAADRRSHSGSPEELRKLATQGDAEAQWQLGTLYHDGAVVPKDDAQAVQWFERAAERGYVRAQAALGSYYWAGRGVPQDFSKAYFWSQLALAQGDENSKLLLEGLATQMTQSQVNKAQQEAEFWLHSHTQGTKPDPATK